MKTILSESSNPDEWFHVLALIEAVRHAKLNTPCFYLITFRFELNRPHQRTRPQHPRILPRHNGKDTGKTREEGKVMDRRRERKIEINEEKEENKQIKEGRER
jgi:hypothetical protein